MARVNWKKLDGQPETWKGVDAGNEHHTVHVQVVGAGRWLIYHNGYRQEEMRASDAATAKRRADRYIFGCLPA